MRGTGRSVGVRTLGLLAFVFLAGYSVAILVTEWRTSQDHIRLYLDDIAGDVTFYLINTSLSVFLLASTALLAVVTLRVTPTATATPSEVGDGSESDAAHASLVRFRRFLWSQAAIFAFLALDDRFQVHEKVAGKIDIPDHFVLGSVAIAEVVFLLLWGPRSLLRETPGRWFVAGAGAFAVMMAIDAFGPEDGRLRLSAEDLMKTWAAWFFVLAAWTLFERQLARLKRPAPAESELAPR